jgi:cation/acetate symporter
MTMQIRTRPQRSRSAVCRLHTPGLVSIPPAFFLGWLGSVTDKHPADPTRFARIQVRALTGIGAERGSRP